MTFILKPFQLCFHIKKLEKIKETNKKTKILIKKVLNESIINGERYKKTNEVVKSQDVAEMSVDVGMRIEL